MNEFSCESLPDGNFGSPDNPLQVFADGVKGFLLVLLDGFAMVDKLNEHVDILEKRNLGRRGQFEQVLVFIHEGLYFFNVVTSESIEEVGDCNYLLEEGRRTRLEVVEANIV
jgi:hypothetical protein